MILNYLDKIKRKNIYSIILIILISGCSSTKDKFERDLPSLPSDWSTSYESLKNISGWAETFNDKELVDIINEAIENNRNLRAASNRLEIARASSRASIAPLLPSVSVGLSKNQISRTIESKDDIKRLYSYKDSLGVQLNWEADIWGRLSRQSRSSFIEAEAAEADYEFVKLSIAGLTAQSWYLFSEAKLQNDLAKRNLETRLSTLKRVENLSLIHISEPTRPY